VSGEASSEGAVVSLSIKSSSLIAKVDRFMIVNKEKSFKQRHQQTQGRWGPR
jgi:hypothetical protein